MSKEIRKENSKRRNKVPFIILFIVLLLVLTVVIFIGIKSKETSEQAGDTNTQNVNSGNMEKWQEGVIKYDGKYYVYNNQIKTYLIMGIDVENDASMEEGTGGQSDAMFLLVTNEKNKTLSVISINRNSMTDVDVYGDGGAILRTVEAQICTQHAFGDGKHLSCGRAVDAVSRLFYNIPITGYLSLQMGAMPILNDAIGGVELEVLHDLTNTSKGVELKAGESVRLSGEEAYVYLRSRDINEFDSATNRLRRQEQYIKAFVQQAKAYTAGNSQKALGIYESVEDYIVTNIDFANFVQELDGYEYDPNRMYTVPGETQMGEKLEEYHVDDDALYHMIIQMFYVEVEHD